MKKICFIGSFSNGGTEKVSFDLANQLIKTHEVCFLNTSIYKPYFNLDSGIKVFYLKGKKLFSKWFNLYSFLKNENIDILISVESGTGVVSLLPAKLARVKHIIWEHANYYQQQWKYIKRLRSIELKLVDAYVVTTDRDLMNFISHYTIRCTIKRIYNMCREESIQYKYNTKSKIILSAGHIRDIKNFIIIPEIGKVLFESYPDWKWHIYGDGNDEFYKKHLKNKIKEYDLENNIILCGQEREMDNVYLNSSIFVCTSKMEGFSLVILEAKECGLPVISFDIECGPSELITNNVNGFLVEPFNVKKMNESIVKLIKDKELRIKYSNNSKIELGKLKKDKIVSQWEALLNEI